MTKYVSKIDVNALFGLRTEVPTAAELLAEDIKKNVENLKASSDSVYGNEPLDKYFSYQVWTYRKMFSHDVVRERLVQSLQAYNRFVSAGQSTPIANLIHPFFRTSEVVSQIQQIMTGIQHDILVNAQEIARNMALESDDIAGLSYKEREELRVHFENIGEKMTMAVSLFDAGNPAEAFRIYSSTLSDNAGYVRWLSRELCSGLLRRYVKFVGDSNKNLCDALVSKGERDYLTSCYSRRAEDSTSDGFSRCAILNLEPVPVDYSKENDSDCCMPDSIEYWPNGNIKKAELNINYTVRNINFYKGTIVEFYEDGKWSAILSNNQPIYGINFIKGDTVIFDEKDKIMSVAIGSDQVIGGVEFYKGTVVGYYEDGQLMSAGLVSGQYVLGIKFPKDSTILFQKKFDIAYGDLGDYSFQEIVKYEAGAFYFSSGNSVRSAFNVILGSNVIVQGMRFQRGTWVVFYEDGSLMCAKLVTDKVIQGEKYFKGEHVFFTKSGRVIGGAR